MKFLSISLLSFALLTASSLLAQGYYQEMQPQAAAPQTEVLPQKNQCSCTNCKCTPQNHCGCYSGKGCACNKAK